MPYGATLALVRDLLDRDGALGRISDVAREIGADPSSLAHALGRLVKQGEAVVFGHGFYARPDVAEAIRTAIDAANAARRAPLPTSCTGAS